MEKKKNPKYKGPQLTLEQHKLELRGSTYTWIFFNKYTVGLPYSHIRDLRIQSTVGISFHIWLNSQMWKYRCSGLTTGLKDPWIWVHLGEPGVSLVAQRVQNLPAMQETWVWSLSQEDPLEKEMQSTPVFLPGESLVGYSPWGHNESDMTEQLTLSSVTFFTMPLLPQTG